MTFKIVNCSNCGEEFNIEVTKNCPECKSIYDESALITPIHKKTESELLVEAQNRTTHAVRSIAITFVAFPITSTALALLLAVSYYFQSLVLMLVSFAAIIVAFIFITFSAIEALKISKIPD